MWVCPYDRELARGRRGRALRFRLRLPINWTIAHTGAERVLTKRVRIEIHDIISERTHHAHVDLDEAETGELGTDVSYGPRLDGRRVDLGTQSEANELSAEGLREDLEVTVRESSEMEVREVPQASVQEPAFDEAREAGELLNRRRYRQICRKTQIRLFLDFDSVLRTNTWDPSRDPVPGGYSTFVRLWDQDLTNQYGLAHLADDADTPSLASGDPIPEHLLLPASAARLEHPEPEFVQGLMEAVSRAHIRNAKAKERGIASRLGKKARVEAVVSHSAALAKKRSRGRGRGGGPLGFTVTRGSSTISMTDTLSDFLEGAASPFSDFAQESNFGDHHEQFIAQLNALEPQQDGQAGPSNTLNREVIDLTGSSTRSASEIPTTETAAAIPPVAPITNAVPAVAGANVLPSTSSSGAAVAPATTITPDAVAVPARVPTPAAAAEVSTSAAGDHDVPMTDPDVELVDFD